MSRTRSNPLLRAFQVLALALLSVAFSALLLEVGLRLFWDGYYVKFQPDHPWAEFEFHPTRGFALGRNLEMMDWDTDFKVMRRHNSHGFRSPEIPIEKPPGKQRVLAIGDSFVYGTGVENDESYPAVLERLEPSLQVINAGVPAYSGAEELVQLREEIGVWKPDLVIAAYFWNDLTGAYPGRYLQFELRDGALYLNPPDPATEDHPAFDQHRKKHERRVRRYGFIARNSYLYRLVSDRMKTLGFILNEWWKSLHPGDAPGPDSASAEDRSEEEPAWQLSFALLREMARVSEAHDARFLLVVIPDQAQVEPDQNVYGLPPFVLDVQERVVGFAQQEDIPVLDPLEELRALRESEGRPQYHPNDRHWNALGQRHMAELLRDELRRRGWIDGA